MGVVRIERAKVLSGPNIWARHPVLDVLISTEDVSTVTEVRELAARIATSLVSDGTEKARLSQVEDAETIAELLLAVLHALLARAGTPASFGRTRDTSTSGEYRLAVGYVDAEAAISCAELAESLLNSAFEEGFAPTDLTGALRQIRRRAEAVALGPSTRAILDAAESRGIPWYRLTEDSLIQLGQGRYSRRIRAAKTGSTTSISVEIASDKQLTKKLLAELSVPVPYGVTVTDARSAIEFAEHTGKPVVVKPLDGNQGRAVSINLTTGEEVEEAFDRARAESRAVIVEEYISGGDYRLLVVGDRMVAAARRRAAHVTGDGRSSVAQLVERLNADPRRAEGHNAALTRVSTGSRLDAVLLRQGLNVGSVPAAGQEVRLSDSSNLSTGGTAADVTDEVHPDNADIAVLAAQTVGLDVAGIDLVCDDISRPLAEQGGAIVEVNAVPGLRMHLYPSEGRPRPVGEAIVDMLFAGGGDARVPLIAVTGTNGKTTVTRMIGFIYSLLGKYVGMTTTDGVYFGGVCREKGDCSGPQSAAAVLHHPRVEVAVLETARGGILRSGLGWDRSMVSVVLNVSSDHLGLGGIETLDELAVVKRVVAENVSPTGYAVLNAEDERVADMAQHCPGGVIFFSMCEDSTVVLEHRSTGGKVAFERAQVLWLAEGEHEVELMPTAEVKAAHGGLVPFQAQNALAAAAACWGAGVPLDAIRQGLREFNTTAEMAPGRFNVFDAGDAKVVIDYGHNVQAMEAIRAAVSRLMPRRSVGVITSPGDRRDADIIALGAVAGRTFDRVIVREGRDLRGRPAGEVAALLAAGVNSVSPDNYAETILDDEEAFEHAILTSHPGDLIFLFVDRVAASIEQVRRLSQSPLLLAQHRGAGPQADLARVE